MKGNYYLAIALIVCGGIIGNVLRYSGSLPEKRPNFAAIPITLDEYSGVELRLDDATYEVLKADTVTYRDYESPDHSREELFIAYFKSQKYGSQIHSPKHCLPGGGWRIESIRPFILHLADSSTRVINLLIIAVRDYRSVMFYWYQTRSGMIRSEYGLKIDLIKNALLFRPTDAAIVRLTVDVPDGDIKNAVDKGVHFLQIFYPYIAKSLPF
jgi:EpsI family protein